MRPWDKIYKFASITYFIIHILVFIFVIIIGSLPFREGENFYQVFTGYFGSTFPVIHPYVLLLVLLLSGICAFFTIRQPEASFTVAILSFAFFMLVRCLMCLMDFQPG